MLLWNLGQQLTFVDRFALGPNLQPHSVRPTPLVSSFNSMPHVKEVRLRASTRSLPELFGMRSGPPSPIRAGSGPNLGSWTSTFGRFRAVRRSCCTHPAGRPSTVPHGRNLRLNPLNDPATVRACTTHPVHHPPADTLMYTVRHASTLAYNPTPCGLPSPSLTGGGGVELPGGCGQLDNLFQRVGR